PWDDSVHMLDAKRYAPMNARDKMPFEVTPIFYKLQRYETAHVEPPVAPAAAPAAAAPNANAPAAAPADGGSQPAAPTQPAAGDGTTPQTPPAPSSASPQ
ncbi:MAG TPA: hypothetical protein VMW15_05805, partial [Terracidiphilus sp.]|nr:hypothetical protein [Terracidiphilus sp.]